ncbi:hypothetical protein [Ornithinibacter aureus]|nr:hypothetical protein [Ornithinibacter aureus]KAF0833882.1 hypothetical protein C8E84_1685 [Ornithinibacter aureus]
MPLGDIWTWVNDNGAGLQAIAVIVTGLVAVAALFRTAEDSRERSRPMVTAELQRGPNSHSVIDLVVRNSGLTVARDLAVRLDPLPVVPAEGGPYVTPFMLRRYAQPIPVLAPGQELRNIWWSGEVVTGSIELQNREPTTDEVKVSVTYRGPGRRRYSDTYSLHVDIVKMTTYEVSSDSLPGRLETIDKSLRRLSAAATSIASQLGRSPASPTSRSHET